MNTPETAAHIKKDVDCKPLKDKIEGEFHDDLTTRLLYATDASAYRELPMAVVWPRHREDIKQIVLFCNQEKVPLIPRSAGTSLAGQVVGNGLVVDVSKHLTRILEINTSERWVRVEPGVVLDELNMELAGEGLFFGPETSTSNRCNMAGMLGNNSCGAHSLIYGSTRDHTLEVSTILSDGSEAVFSALSDEDFKAKCQGNLLENKIYQTIQDILSNPENQEEIQKQYPLPTLNRRNTGYALDILMNTSPFKKSSPPFNMCKLLAGSEGTLAFTTEIKLNLVPLPPPQKAVVCVHFTDLESAFAGNLTMLQYKPVAIEVMDRTILELTRDNIEQKKNRFFVEGTPEAILIAEFVGDSMEEIKDTARRMEQDLRSKKQGYHFPLVTGPDIQKVWNLRKAGLGILSNMKGDAKPVPVIEDTAVKVEDLPEYMLEFKQILDKHGKDCVYYAHIGGGELHLRPILNLKDPKDVELFHTIAYETALLVKKYRGSLSGEHGDGRLRGEFIPLMIGQKNYTLLKAVKNAWDPDHIFNPGKIVDTPRMNSFLRYEPGQETPEFETVFDFSDSDGYLRAIEKCNGSGDCRKSEIIGGTMCPSFMATRDESTTTRARANLLRELLSRPLRNDPFRQKELYDILDLCLSCKGCKSECPSNVDMAKLKAEFMQHYYDRHSIPLRTIMIAYISRIQRIGSLIPGLFNWATSVRPLSGILKRMIGFARERSIPKLGRSTVRQWIRRHLKSLNPSAPEHGKVYLFLDEFTNYTDTVAGIKTIQLLSALGYEVQVPDHSESGRTFLSKGLLRTARKRAIFNIEKLSGLISEQTPLVGIEPSAILAFRDEYPDLVRGNLKVRALKLAENALLLEEFLVREMKKGNIGKAQFTAEPKHIQLHGHCQQKAIASTEPLKMILSLPEHFTVEEIPSGCCGMAGSFGYEKEHYELSMKVGELVLFPAIRSAAPETLVVAPGTSCRHQIKDGTGTTACHPAEVLFDALA
jgi:FAD/FMN-containing dehydrogenase/Fe-S oxidoreductase